MNLDDFVNMDGDVKKVEDKSELYGISDPAATAAADQLLAEAQERLRAGKHWVLAVAEVNTGPDGQSCEIELSMCGCMDGLSAPEAYALLKTIEDTVSLKRQDLTNQMLGLGNEEPQER